MNLHAWLAARETPVRVGLIGAGKFGSMFLAQVPHIANLEVAAIADLDPDRARAAVRAVGWDEARVAATRFVDSGAALIGMDGVEVVVGGVGGGSRGARDARGSSPPPHPPISFIS